MSCNSGHAPHVHSPSLTVHSSLHRAVHRTSWTCSRQGRICIPLKISSHLYHTHVTLDANIVAVRHGCLALRRGSDLGESEAANETTLSGDYQPWLLGHSRASPRGRQADKYGTITALLDRAGS